jgi:hypothetical protein
MQPDQQTSMQWHQPPPPQPVMWYPQSPTTHRLSNGAIAVLELLVILTLINLGLTFYVFSVVRGLDNFASGF